MRVAGAQRGLRPAPATRSAHGGEVDPEIGFLFKAEDELWGAPVLEDGVLYVTSLDGNLYALDSATCNVIWTFNGAKGLATTPVISGERMLAQLRDAS